MTQKVSKNNWPKLHEKQSAKKVIFETLKLHVFNILKTNFLDFKIVSK